jgi:hypothetical protein
MKIIFPLSFSPQQENMALNLIALKTIAFKAEIKTFIQN